MGEGGISTGEAAGVITASGGFLVVLGKGFAWINRQRKGRIGRLEDEMRKLAQAQMTYVRQVDCLVTVAFLLVDDISQHRPDAPVIGTAKALIGSEFPDLLRRAFPIGAMPIDMIETILKAKRTGE